jgi:antirestriction protein ArdC
MSETTINATQSTEGERTGPPDPKPLPPAAKSNKYRLTKEERTERLEAAFNELNSAVERIVTSDDWRKYLDFQSRFNKYSARNTLWLQAQAKERNMEVDVFASFGTWKKQGRTVKRGEHGFRVLAPIVYQREKSELEIEADQRNMGAMKSSGNIADPSKTTESEVRGFTLATVFDLSQTDGPPETLPKNPVRVTPIVGQCDQGIFDALVTEIKAAGYEVKFVDGEDWTPSTNGRTTPKIRTVEIRNSLSPAAQAKTLAHELTHIVLEHDHSDSRSETEAESIAYLVMNHLGIDAGEYSFGYVAGWANNTDTVLRSAETIRRVATKLCYDLDNRIEREEPVANTITQSTTRDVHIDVSPGLELS